MGQYIKKTLLLLIALIAVLALTGCGSKTKIDLTEYVHVDISGVSGYGYAHAYTDGTKLDALAADTAKDDESALDRMEKIGQLAQIECAIDKTEKLANGDVITVTITYPDTLAETLDADITPKSGESWNIVVNDLKELHEYDVFGDVEVSFEGWNGYGKAVIELSGGSRLVCSASQTDGLSNGDVITVTLEAPNGGDLIDYCISEEFLPAVESKEYTVSDLEEAPRIDLFEDMDITIEGRSPFLSLTIRGKYVDDGIGYELDEGFFNGALIAGDTVTIRAYGEGFLERVDLAKRCMENLNGLPAAETYTYTIPADQEYYLMVQEQLSEEILAQIIEEARDYFDAEGKAEELSIQGVRYYGYYLQSAKSANVWGDRCCLYLVHEVEYTRDGARAVGYNVVCFQNPFVDKDSIFRTEDAQNLYGWIWDSGIADLYDFEEEFITPCKADYETVTGK